MATEKEFAIVKFFNDIVDVIDLNLCNLETREYVILQIHGNYALQKDSVKQLNSQPIVLLKDFNRMHNIVEEVNANNKDVIQFESECQRELLPRIDNYIIQEDSVKQLNTQPIVLLKDFNRMHNIVEEANANNQDVIQCESEIQHELLPYIDISDPHGNFHYSADSSDEDNDDDIPIRGIWIRYNKTLYSYLYKKHNDCYIELIKEFTVQKYQSLLEVTFSLLTIVNHKSSSDLECITLLEWNGLKKVDNRIALFNQLNHQDQLRASDFYFLSIKRKKSEFMINLFITPKLYISIKRLLDDRHKTNISKNNQYLFCLSGSPFSSENHLSGFEILQSYVQDCGIADIYE